MKNLASKTSITAALALSIVLLSAFSVSNNKVTICHKNHHQITVSENAVQAHLNHGDNIGSCFTTHEPAPLESVGSGGPKEEERKSTTNYLMDFFKSFMK